MKKTFISDNKRRKYAQEYNKTEEKSINTRQRIIKTQWNKHIPTPVTDQPVKQGIQR